jgi:hypothetical protein
MNNNTDVLRAEESGVEYFTVVATGKSGLSITGTARSLGVSQQSITKLKKRVEKAVTTEQLEQALQPLLGKDLTLTTGSNYKNVTVLNSDTWAAFAEYYAFDAQKKTPEAADVFRAFGRIGAESFIQGKTGWLPNDYQSSRESRQSINRIMEKKCPYDALYKKDMCIKAFTWFGANFYWSFFYFWMSQQERCDVDNRNPVVKGKRKSRIHQWIEPETKERLRDKAIELRALIVAARSKAHFIELFQNSYGDGWQMSIFD